MRCRLHLVQIVGDFIGEGADDQERSDLVNEVDWLLQLAARSREQYETGRLDLTSKKWNPMWGMVANIHNACCLCSDRAVAIFEWIEAQVQDGRRATA